MGDEKASSADGFGCALWLFVSWFIAVMGFIAIVDAIVVALKHCPC